MQYKVKTYKPSTKEIKYVHEIKNKNLLDIIKYIQANDDHGLNLYFNEFLGNDNTLNIIDKFFIILQLRALNFNNRVVIAGLHKTGKEALSKIDIFKFLGEYIAFIESYEGEFYIKIDDLEIKFTLPKNLYFKNIYALMLDCIADVKIGEESLYKNKTEKQKLEIIINLKKEIIEKFKEKILEINSTSSLFFHENKNSEANLPNIRISFFNNTLFNVLKSIFKLEISYFYQRLYIFLNKVNFSYDSFMELTFVETDILLSIYKSANKIK
jgi:hypothetical protein